ncbi:hypothetical protein HU200_045225 [Digitaria exilis]|uniref:RNase H type-1 domain-containing protein n=1 Tax=Digitaria exilis TaxID=1010633 RepID=A0A835B007_9POAL|nr:hypothetical protein HU200_045225 [Digitaria exilis]
MCKINVDAAVLKNGKVSTVSAVARDANGLFLGTSAQVMSSVTDAKTTEALVRIEGMALVRDLFLQRFRLATDCANVVRSFNGLAHVLAKSSLFSKDGRHVWFSAPYLILYSQ